MQRQVCKSRRLVMMISISKEILFLSIEQHILLFPFDQMVEAFRFAAEHRGEVNKVLIG